ncbi:PIN domain-containing protein [Candidatus Roizmanbacteria bacterium]|nr:PIN domain-containing protein [Candidatus Roizmanbacteria bacterium]
MKLFVDTNIFLRYLLADHKTQSPTAKKLFTEAKEGKLTLVTHPLVISEIFFMLSSYYRFTKEEIIEKMRIVLLFEGLEIKEKNILFQAISFYEEKNIDFVDAYVAAYCFKSNVNVCSFDKDFDKIKEIKRIDPFLLDKLS